jgi:hypothetical protein
MVKEVLVNEVLTSEMVSAGNELVQYLGNSALKIDGLLWLFSAENNTWHFVIVSPEVKVYGPKKVYQNVREVIENIPKNEQKIPFESIFVLDSKDQLIQSLRQSIRPGSSLAGIRFSQNIINGVMIDDAYIYKLA